MRRSLSTQLKRYLPVRTAGVALCSYVPYTLNNGFRGFDLNGDRVFHQAVSGEDHPIDMECRGGALVFFSGGYR